MAQAASGPAALAAGWRSEESDGVVKSREILAMATEEPAYVVNSGSDGSVDHKMLLRLGLMAPLVDFAMVH